MEYNETILKRMGLNPAQVEKFLRERKESGKVLLPDSVGNKALDEFYTEGVGSVFAGLKGAGENLSKIKGDASSSYKETKDYSYLTSISDKAKKLVTIELQKIAKKVDYSIDVIDKALSDYYALPDHLKEQLTPEYNDLNAQYEKIKEMQLKLASFRDEKTFF